MRVWFLSTLGLLVAVTAAPAQDAPELDAAYEAYAEILGDYVESGRVDYARWIEDDPPAWRAFLDWLAEAQPEAWPIADQRAFWINAYNARVIAGVLERYPIDSVRDVGLLGGRLRGFFGRREHAVAGEVRTLDEIERDILFAEPLWDPRIHWALTCASLGCAWLRPEPYSGSQLDMQLDFQARTYLNGPSGHRIDPEKRRLYLTPILDWHDDDFERAAGTIRAYASQYLTGAALEAASDETYEIKFLDYDWGLNDTP